MGSEKIPKSRSDNTDHRIITVVSNLADPGGDSDQQYNLDLIIDGLDEEDDDDQFETDNSGSTQNRNSDIM